MKPRYTAKAIREAKTRALNLLDALEGKGRFKGDMGNFCYADGIFANSIASEFKTRDFRRLRKWAAS